MLSQCGIYAAVALVSALHISAKVCYYFSINVWLIEDRIGPILHVEASSVGALTSEWLGY
jgi:hypothetical protein